MKLISIITINYNNHSVTEELIQSFIKNNTYKNIEFIVVDNKSTPNPVPAWQKKYPGFHFIRSEKNRGFAGGNNLGIAHASGEYLFFINNDTEITENLIETLADTLEKNPNVGMVSPKIRYYDEPEMLQYAGYTPMNFFTARNRCIGQYEKDCGQHDHCTGPTGYAHGAAMMVKRKAMEKSGLMAENFFLYYEELEWCERFKKSGYEIWVQPKALIYHKESVSVGRQSALKEYYMNRNRLLFMRRHAPAFSYSFFLAFYLLIILPKTILTYLINGQVQFIPLLFKALWWNATNSVHSNNLYFPPPAKTPPQKVKPAFN